MVIERQYSQDLRAWTLYAYATCLRVYAVLESFLVIIKMYGHRAAIVSRPTSMDFVCLRQLFTCLCSFREFFSRN
jgi:hypothetical protein